MQSSNITLTEGDCFKYQKKMQEQNINCDVMDWWLLIE